MFKKVVKHTSILSSGTFVSRLLGFVRDVLVARAFGTTALLEAFIVAFRLPNLFRSIFAEGFGDAVATPILSEYQKDKDKLFAISNNLLSIFFVVVFIFTVLGIIFSKYLVILIAPGFINQPDKFQLAVSFARITFLYLLFIGIAINSTSILYSLKKFFIPAINPAFLNIAFILGLVFFSDVFKNYILVVCVVGGGILQVIFPLISLRKEGFRFRFNLRAALGDKIIKRMLKLFPPRIWSSITYHLSVIIDTIFSSLTHIVGEGALAAVWYANRLIQFPLALIVLPISRVAIVDLSYYHKQGNMDDFKKLLVFSFQNIIFFIVPISVIFMFLPGMLIDVIFKRGEFSLHSLEITSSVLFFYSFGLFFFCAIKLLVNTFYSLKDTLTPAKTTTLSLVINIVLSAILIFPLKIGGVALGSSLAAIFNCFILYRCLIKRIGHIDWGDTKIQFIKIIFLSLVTAAIGRLAWDSLLYNKYLNMVIVVAVASCVFVVGGYILHIKQIKYVKSLMRKNEK